VLARGQRFKRSYALGIALVTLSSRALGGEEREASELRAARAEKEEAEHTFVVGIGGAAEVELGDGSFHPGANLMIEWDAVENWLELELGASVLALDGGIEVPDDLLIKKPFKLARGVEFMIGIGPELVHASGNNAKNKGGSGTYFGGEAALDFMFWPWGGHVGLWIAPEYDLLFPPSGPSSGVGGTGGVLLGW